jgi:hypothetical protein
VLEKIIDYIIIERFDYKATTMKPLYTLNSIDLLIRYGLNYAMGSHYFSIECRGEEGFSVTCRNNENDFFRVVNTNNFVKVYLQPSADVQTEYEFCEIDNNIYSLKDAFDSWIRMLYEKQNRAIFQKQNPASMDPKEKIKSVQ